VLELTRAEGIRRPPGPRQDLSDGDRRASSRW
jgi:hypothetical protein